MQKRKGQPPSVDASATAELFRLPLDQFTAARNAMAARLKKSGHADTAAQVKALTKPPASAWVVNQLFWKHPKEMEALLETGEQFRRAQAQQLAGKQGDLRGTLDARRQALTTLSRLAFDIFRESGHTAGPDVARRVTTTLEALAAYGRQPGAPQAGYLTADVDSPGFEALAALIPRGAGDGARTSEARLLTFQAPRPPAPKKKTSPEEKAREQEEERRARRAAAKAAVQEAEQAVRSARTAAGRAEETLKKAAAVAKKTESERAEIEARLDKAAAAANAARQEARRVASEAEDAAQAVTDAERALEKARAALET